MPGPEGHPIDGRAVRRIAPGVPQHVEEAIVEDIGERTPGCFLVSQAVEVLEPAVPSQDAIVAVDDRDPVVQRFEDVLAELPHPIELVGLDPELTVEAAVLERRGRLRRNCGEQRHVLAAERLGAGFPAERHHRYRPFLGDARDEVVDPGLAPDVHLGRIEAVLGQRIVERQGVPGGQPARDIGLVEQRRNDGAETGVGDGDEGVVLAGRRRREHQRHAIDHQRLGHPAQQPLAEPRQVQIAVQVAGETDQRPAVVVAIAVVGAVERILDRVLDRAGQQHHDDRRQQRDDRVGFLTVQEEAAGEAEQHRVDRGDRRQRSGGDQRPLDDDLDVHQPVADDRRGKRQRHQAQEHGRGLEQARRGVAEGIGKDVTQDERDRAQCRAPDNPAQLTPGHDRAAAPQRTDHDRQSANQAARRGTATRRARSGSQCPRAPAPCDPLRSTTATSAPPSSAAGR